MTVHELLGVAMGCLHLSYDDFYRLTPAQFEHVYKAYRDARDSDYKDSWERIRMLATIVIQPHVKNKLTPQKLLPFPWEQATRAQSKSMPQITAAEDKERLSALIKRIGT